MLRFTVRMALVIRMVDNNMEIPNHLDHPVISLGRKIQMESDREQEGTTKA
jgi:hypothetical protein